jgi:secondary thiamine-phosphate synthase enzyme
MRETIRLDTREREQLIDITEQVRAVVARSGVREGLVSLYCQHTSAALMIQENWDASVPNDVVTLLRTLVPRGAGWQHDAQDDNADAHLKAGLLGPSQTIPLIGGALALGRWQNVFFCEFDGPRQGRSVVCTVLADG